MSCSIWFPEPEHYSLLRRSGRARTFDFDHIILYFTHVVLYLVEVMRDFGQVVLHLTCVALHVIYIGHHILQIILYPVHRVRHLFHSVAGSFGI